jgi:hypothetical protein
MVSMTAGMSERLTSIATFDLDQLLAMFLDEGCGTLEYSAAVGSAHSAPDLQSGPGRLDGHVNISLAAQRDRRDGLFRGRIDIE